MIKRYLSSTIGKKQIVAISGLLLVLYLVFHLTMNSLIFAGAEIYNFFPEQAHSTGIFLRLIEAGLAAVFIIHIVFTIQVVRRNRRARAQGYAEFDPKGKRSLATKLMPYTATVLIVFLVFHLWDYTFADSAGVASFLDGETRGLYGVVVNSFQNIWRVIGYIIAMFAVGFHLAHGIQSTFQTLGINGPNFTPRVRVISTVIGVVIAAGFSAIPIYIYFFKGSL